MRVARGCALLVAAGLALVLVAYLAVNLASVVQAGRERDRLADTVTERLATEVPPARDRLQRDASSAGVDPDEAWIEQTCQFDTDDGGWIVQKYRDVCELKAVSAWVVDDEASARGIAARLAPLDDDATALDPCEALAEDDTTRTTFVPAGTDLAEDGFCTGLTSASSSREVIEGDPLDGRLDEGRLVVVTTSSLLDEDIGCSHWSVLFCSNPFEGPFGGGHAFGDAPPD